MHTGANDVRVAARVLEPPQPALDRLPHRERLADREPDRRVDRDAARGRLLDRHDARGGGRELDLDVRREPVEPLALGEHRVGVPVQRRVRLEAEPALAAGVLVEHGAERRGGADAHLLGDRPREVDLGPRRVGRGELPDARLPGLALAAHDLADDDRVGGRARAPALDGVRDVVQRAGVVPEVGRRPLDHRRERAVDQGHGHVVLSSTDRRRARAGAGPASPVSLGWAVRPVKGRVAPPRQLRFCDLPSTERERRPTLAAKCVCLRMSSGIAAA